MTTRQKPSGFTLFGQFYPAGSWRDVLLGVSETLAQRHGAAFASAVFEVKGKKRQYIAPSPEGMIVPAQIPGTELWVEANQRAVSVQKLADKLLVALGHHVGDWAVRTDGSRGAHHAKAPWPIAPTRLHTSAIRGAL